MTDIPLSIPLFAPLAFGLVAALLRGRVGAIAGLVGSLITLAYAVLLLFDFDHSRDGLQYVTDTAWITTLGIRYKLGLDGLNLWLFALTALVSTASFLWIVLRPVEPRTASASGQKMSSERWMVSWLMCPPPGSRGRGR